MNLYEALRFKFPNARIFVDYETRDEEIKEWNIQLLGPVPTPEQIIQFKAEAQAAKDAADTAAQQERTGLIALRDKLQGGNDLTAAELRVLLRFLIRKTL